jgi:hypothetical protein
MAEGKHIYREACEEKKGRNAKVEETAWAQMEQTTKVEVKSVLRISSAHNNVRTL